MDKRIRKWFKREEKREKRKGQGRRGISYCPCGKKECVEAQKALTKGVRKEIIDYLPEKYQAAIAEERARLVGVMFTSPDPELYTTEEARGKRKYARVLLVARVEDEPEYCVYIPGHGWKRDDQTPRPEQSTNHPPRLLRLPSPTRSTLTPSIPLLDIARQQG
jgi:hypothetical protein